MKILLTLVAFIATAMPVAAYSNVRFNNESTDTTRINEILVATAAQEFRTPGERNDFIAKQFVGTPYRAGTLDIAPEAVTVNLDAFDCTTFADVVLALSATVGEGRTSWRDFIYNLERMRYRGGEEAGYASRLHYICDWVVDNVHRGTVTDATRIFPFTDYIIRTMDFMSSNRDKYAMLADSAEFERIKSVEIGYRSHRFPYVKTANLRKKETVGAFRSGDMVAFVSSLKNLDVSHVGFVTMVGGEPHLVHASSAEGKVTVSPLSLADQLKSNRSVMGVRVIRLKD